MGTRLCQFTRHDAITLLRFSLSLPRLSFTLRTAPAFLSASLTVYDRTMCSLLSSVLNIALDFDSPSWVQATLPIRLGCLGFRSAVHLAPSCYLSSTAAARPLVGQILPDFTPCLRIPHDESARSRWSGSFPSLVPPSLEDEVHQRKWDDPIVQSTFTSLLVSAPDDINRARLIAVSTTESGAWLRALPVSSLGLSMEDSSIRVCVALHLGLPVCVPHNCRNCGESVCPLGLHGLLCKKGTMRFHRHAAVNDFFASLIFISWDSDMLGAPWYF